MTLYFDDGTEEKVSLTYTEWVTLFKSGKWYNKTIKYLEVTSSSSLAVSRIYFS